MKALQALLTGASAAPLDRAALELASIEFPGLDPAPYLARIGELSARIPAGADGPAFLAAANRVLFTEAGISGNASDYYNPRNSCLNEVLDRKTGIPITIAVLYLEIARRHGAPVLGVGLPGHFMVRYDDGEFAAYIDVFHQGALLDAEECRALIQRVAGVDIFSDAAFLRPVDARHIAIRMLNNLRSVYFRRRNPGKAVQVLDLLLTAAPSAAPEYRQRAVLNTELKRYGAAREDFLAYLRLAPDAPDRAEIERQLQQLRTLLSALN
ncbi:MAG TPA: hypothetical protein DEH78_09180 [Solibacterales bacterium]|nr:hypothetical protein [Bryobacterales bacterium]